MAPQEASAAEGMSIDLFRRQMEWKRAANARVEETRKQITNAAGHTQMCCGSQGGASAGEHVDSYWEYRRLVGESDGGTLLSTEEYAALKLKATIIRKISKQIFGEPHVTSCTLQLLSHTLRSADL